MARGGVKGGDVSTIFSLFLHTTNMFVFKEGAERVLSNFFTSEQIQSMVDNFRNGVGFCTEDASRNIIMHYSVHSKKCIDVHEAILCFDSSLYAIDAHAIFDQNEYMTIPNGTPNNPYARHVWYDAIAVE